MCDIIHNELLKIRSWNNLYVNHSSDYENPGENKLPLDTVIGWWRKINGKPNPNTFRPIQNQL